MFKASLTCLFCTTVLLASSSAHAEATPSSAPPSTSELLRQFGSAPNGLARYSYLTSVIPVLHGDDKSLAQQLLATVDSELGLYDEALMTFPFDNRIAPPRKMPLPAVDDWHSVDAAYAVEKLAAKRHIVMINEAHHDAHTRELTLELLPRLRALGFQYFAVEALGEEDPNLMQRGYATDQSGTEYLLEPLYGEIIRQAIKLGYILVPYDPERASLNDRDTQEARTLYEKVFAKDPKAKLFVHAGYSHIDKAPGNLGDDIQPMAMQLKQLSGYDPLCVDQVQFRDVAVGGIDFGFYSTVAVGFMPRGPIVLRNRHSDTIWTSDSLRHDVTVILPPAAERDLDVNGIMKADVLRREIVLPRTPFDLDDRPDWLTLNHQRVAFPIALDMCNGQLPCVIEAHYSNEPDTAIPADRYTFTHTRSHNVLYLYPGRYRLRAWNASGATLSQQDIEVPGP
ncbi:hypothetical protein [Dyella caseinilytica]|uniref:Erythromycin esterase n=1 Tax=Dyella caseinilytica TaxID=1849581 RepID=A0ABX7GXH5_9GAMM|nr:hypothetical protein [Dyella caseinilytica]QRN54648.1 hypothetical protein ISN74_04625 [Dyella caseinilytica]GFZ95815.1 hypothetical protein GCM10011408_15090 [Dyella caseinilytica]